MSYERLILSLAGLEMDVDVVGASDFAPEH
jgi:hypothetical protein